MRAVRERRRLVGPLVEEADDLGRTTAVEPDLLKRGALLGAERTPRELATTELTLEMGGEVRADLVRRVVRAPTPRADLEAPVGPAGPRGHLAAGRAIGRGEREVSARGPLEHTHGARGVEAVLEEVGLSPGLGGEDADVDVAELLHARLVTGLTLDALERLQDLHRGGVLALPRRPPLRIPGEREPWGDGEDERRTAEHLGDLVGLEGVGHRIEAGVDGRTTGAVRERVLGHGHDVSRLLDRGTVLRCRY